MELAIEEFLDRKHRRELCPEAEVHHCCLNKVIKMMPHRDQAYPIPFRPLEEDAALKTQLKLSKEDISRMKYYNMFSVV